MLKFTGLLFINSEIKDITDVYFGEKSGQYWPHYNFGSVTNCMGISE